jgi:hypothetical protein
LPLAVSCCLFLPLLASSTASPHLITST